MVVNIKRTDVIIPKWKDNDKQKESEQIKVNVKFFNTLEYEDFIDRSTGNLDTKTMFMKSIISVENLSIVEDGKEKKIESGKDILETPGLEQLFTELFTTYNKLSAIDKKK